VWLVSDALLDGVVVLGGAPEPLLVVVVGVAILAGPEPGAVAGFVAGLSVDLLVLTPFGLTALVWCLVGWGTGLAVDRLVRRSWWIPPVAVAVASMAAVLLFALGAAVLGAAHLTTLDRMSVAVGVGLMHLVLAVPILHAVRWARP
jgi:rod shape-determining protein MreD